MTDIENTNAPPDDVGFGAYDADPDASSAIAYHCCACKEKHDSSDEVYLPCCDAAMCRDAFSSLMQRTRDGWWHDIHCPACKARLPTFMTLNRPSRRLVPASYVTAFCMSVLLNAADLISWTISPGMPLGVLLCIAYVTLNLLGFCMNIASSPAGFCFDAMADFRAWTLTVASELPNASFAQVSLLRTLTWAPHPFLVVNIAMCLVLLTLAMWITWSHRVQPAIKRLFRKQLRQRLSLYYNPHATI